MAITATLVHASPNWLRYLINATVGSGEVVTILTTDGGATPNLRTDSPAGPIHAIASAGAYGKLTAVTTDAQAEALWQSEDAESVVGPNLPTAICQYNVRTGIPMLVDALISGVPGIAVTATAAGAASGYLDILIPGAIGV